MPKPSPLIPDIVPPKSRKYACKIYEHFDDIAFCGYKPRSVRARSPGGRPSGVKGESVSNKHSKGEAEVPIEYLTRFGDEAIMRALSPRPPRKEVLFERCQRPAAEGMSMQQFELIKQEIEDEHDKQSRLEEYLKEFEHINGRQLKSEAHFFDKESVKPMWYKRQFATSK